MGDNELTLNYEGYAYLEDLETGQQINIGSSTSKKDYTDKLQQHLSTIKQQLLNKGIAYTLINTKLPIDKALKDFLNQRSKLI
jgi:hypothetical protein